jgi:hypothetical protein
MKASMFSTSVSLSTAWDGDKMDANGGNGACRDDAAESNTAPIKTLGGTATTPM